MFRFSTAPHILALGLFFGGAILAPTPAEAQYQVISKSCDNCGRAVSINSQVGDTCPYCGVTWGAENQQIIPDLQPAPEAVNTASANFKWCIDCGRKVSAASRPGQRCPHCGVRWAYYDRGYRPGRSRRSGGRGGRFTPAYSNSGPSLDWVAQQNIANVQNIQNQMNQQRLMDQQIRQMTPPPLPSR